MSWRGLGERHMRDALRSPWSVPALVVGLFLAVVAAGAFSAMAGGWLVIPPARSVSLSVAPAWREVAVPRVPCRPR